MNINLSTTRFEYLLIEFVNIYKNLSGLNILSMNSRKQHERVSGRDAEGTKAIVAKKWDPGILDPGPFLGQIRKVEARLGKLAKIRKVETN